MTTETITTLIHIWLGISIFLPFIILSQTSRKKKIKKEIANLKNKVQQYEEMLYAAKDGFLLYTAHADKTEQECSRRLATLLNLKNGMQSTFSEVFGVLEKQDSDKLNTFFTHLIEDGASFETMVKTKANKIFTVTGMRINSTDLETTTSCLWFRDITESAAFINRATDEAFHCRKQVEEFRILIDNLPCPIWLRDENLNITILNKNYLKLLGLKDFKELTPENAQLHDLGNTTNLQELAKIAKESNTPQKKQINILSDGDLKKFELTETPYYDSSLKTSHTIGSLIDITSFDEAKRNYRVHLDSHLEILSSLDTAFCIINTKHNFTFGNTAFLNLWNLPENFLDSAPHYNTFLDTIREAKILPEVPDFKQYKEEENKAFDALTEQHEDLLYIPDGRTFRRLRAPHPDGTIIAYEDITDRLAISRKLDSMQSVQKSILETISDSILIFSPALKLVFHNQSYEKLWNIDKEELSNELSLKDILDKQQKYLPELNDWQTFREDMQKHITACTPFTLTLKNKKQIKVTPAILTDSSLLITYHKE